VIHGAIQGAIEAFQHVRQKQAAQRQWARWTARHSYEVQLYLAFRPRPISKSFKDLTEVKLDRGMAATLKAELFTFAQACLAFF